MINNDQLISKIQSYNKFSSIGPLNKAYNFAIEAHKNQKRISGAPYVVHPVAVADILAELQLDSHNNNGVTARHNRRYHDYLRCCVKRIWQRDCRFS